MKLPTGAVTLMAGAEGSARLWQTQPDDMAAALPWLRTTAVHLIALNDGILRSGLDNTEGFVATFGRASDALSCALALQLAPTDPFSLCIGVHSVADGAAKLCDVAHGGQTLISGTTVSSGFGGLPAGATLTHLGSHRLDDPQWQERLFELRHPGLPKRIQLLDVPQAVLAHDLLN
ncbi:LuxR family transcriptional regulator [Mycolicibacterium wolinskyi]|uniref:LuxR family transcriptional regulator n=1 Tax=Mycolicibacterium wolinskyi TaxID=59750 RepID=UPI001F18CC37|nr:LuxR family transcriptional regulator [Mycolicibacterium wolinskyi]